MSTISIIRTAKDNNQRQLARSWVNSYAIGGTALVVAAVFPGSTSVALMGIEAKMCLHIGQIYRGPQYSMRDAFGAAAAVGLACVLGKIAALEALNWIPWAGWAAKAAIAGAVIKGLGEAIIEYYETHPVGGLPAIPSK
ncbi:MAG: hypothetical protein JNL67_08345 [Planctomycetaceae bacterium]|nr:hypothetical protein [Planctomycetaceae bacterium]